MIKANELITINNNKTVTFSYGIVHETITYDEFKAFVSQLNAMVAKHERILKIEQPKDAA